MGIFRLTGATETQSAAFLRLDQEGPRKGFCQFTFRDTLSSMASTGRDFGVMFFALISAAFSKLFSSLLKHSDPIRSSARQVYNLEDPQQFLQAWEENPFQVMKKLLSLLNENPLLAKNILMNIAEDWKRHPERYAEYDKRKVQDWEKSEKGRAIRTNMIAALNGLWKQLILSSEQLNLENRITQGELTEPESHVMTPKMSRREKGSFTSEQQIFRKSFLELKQAKRSKPLWDHIFAFLLGEESTVSDLYLHSRAEHLDQSEEMDFGHTLERIFFYRNVHAFRVDGTFQWTQQLLIKLFSYLRDSTDSTGRTPLLNEYPKIQALITLALPLLQDPAKAARVQVILLEVIDKAWPINKSPPRKSTRARRPPSRFS